MVIQKSIPIFLFYCFICTPAFSQDSKQIDLPPISVSPPETYQLQKINSVSYIDREQFETSKAADIHAPLSKVNSVNIMNGVAGSTAAFSIRGASGGQGLVLFDGVPLFANLAGFYALRRFRSDIVDSLEVNRGFDQLLSNSRTLGGHLNLQSRKLVEGESILKAEFGSDQAKRATLASGWGDSKDNVTIVIGRTLISDRDSQSSTYSPTQDKDPYRMKQALVRGEKSFSRGSIDGSLYYVKVNENTDGPRLTPNFKVAWLDDPDSWYSEKFLVSQIRANLSVSDNWQSQLQLGYTEARQDGELGTFRPILPYGPFSNNLSSYLTMANLQNYHSFNLENDVDLKVNWGISTQHQWATTTVNNLSESHTLLSPSLGLSFTVNDWLINLSSQLNDDNEYGSHVSYGLGIKRKLTPTLHTWVNYGRKWRAPGVNERLHPLYGNLNLKSESAVGGEVGMQWQNQSSILSLSAYQHDYDDLVLLSFDATTGFTKATNVKTAQLLGLEFNLEHQWSDSWKTDVSYTYTRAENKSASKNVVLRPKHRVNITNNWKITPQLNWSIEATAHNGYWFDTLNHLWSGSVTKVNTALSYQFNKQSKAYFRIDNITDNDTVELYGFRPKARSLFIGGEIQWH